MNAQFAAISVGASGGQCMAPGTTPRNAGGCSSCRAFAFVLPFPSSSYRGKNACLRIQMEGV